MAEYAFPGPPPKEALAYFRAKGHKVGFDHRDVWREEHASAFTVAKAMDLDLRKDIKQAVDNALAEGKTFREFARDLTPELVKRGWWGKKAMVDPLTGEERTVQLGSPRRLRTIYRTNMRTARAAGQWERIQRTKDAMPYLLYSLGPSERHRPEHVAWSGTLLPVDDPWWSAHYPPNGWGCRCRVRQVGNDEAKRLGARPGVSTKAPPTRTVEWTNKRTGEVHQVPAGIDPGWDYNVGEAGRLAKSLDHLTRTLDEAPHDMAAARLRDVMRGDLMRAWMADPRGEFPVAVLPEAHRKLIGALPQAARLSKETFVKQQQRHSELEPPEYAKIQDTVDRGEVIQDGPRSLVYLLEEPEGYVSVFKATRSGEGLFMTSFRRMSSEDPKRSEEIRRLKGKGK